MTGRKAERKRRALGVWYDRHRRDLPWRRTSDPYAVWVSEVMLQQTRVETVIPYYWRWLARFPDPDRLAAADLQTVLKSWEGLGYYARARNFHKAARIVVDRHGGRVPADPQSYRSLPGVGDYIAAAVLSIAFGVPLAVVDGNVKRVLARLEQIDRPVNAPGAHKAFLPAAGALLDRDDPGRWNQALMELGALVCTPRQPGCDHCPLAGDCRSRQQGTVSEFPRRVRRRAIPEHRLVMGVVRRDDRLLVVQRPAEGLLGGLWEFPGGARSDGRPEADCAARIGESLNIEVRVGRRLARIRHAYTHFRIEADVFCCRWAAGRVRRRGPAAHRWLRPAAMAPLPFTGACRKFLEQAPDCLGPD